MSVHLKNDEGYCPSFEGVFNNYQSHLIYFARKLLGDQLAAEDIVAEVFVKYWHKEKDFANFTAAKTFLEVSTRNACLNYLRNRQRQKKKERLLQNGCKDHEDFVLNQMIKSEIIKEAWNIIDNLPQECRRIVLMGHVKGIGNKAIAQLLEISPHTVKNQKIRGLQLIKERFNKLNTINDHLPKRLESAV